MPLSTGTLEHFRRVWINLSVDESSFSLPSGEPLLQFASYVKMPQLYSH